MTFVDFKKKKKKKFDGRPKMPKNAYSEKWGQKSKF